MGVDAWDGAFSAQLERNPVGLVARVTISDVDAQGAVIELGTLGIEGDSDYSRAARGHRSLSRLDLVLADLDDSAIGHCLSFALGTSLWLCLSLGILLAFCLFLLLCLLSQAAFDLALTLFSDLCFLLFVRKVADCVFEIE